MKIMLLLENVKESLTFAVQRFQLCLLTAKAHEMCLTSGVSETSPWGDRNQSLQLQVYKITPPFDKRQLEVLYGCINTTPPISSVRKLSKALQNFPFAICIFVNIFINNFWIFEINQQSGRYYYNFFLIWNRIHYGNENILNLASEKIRKKN